MKQLFIIAAVCFTNQFNASAQKAHFGVQAGAAISNLTVKVQDYSVSAKSLTGITAGLLGDIPLGKSFSFQPAVNFVQYGTKAESEDGAEKGQMKISCLEAPLNFMYNAVTGKGRLYIGAGPAISFNVSGKRKSYDNVYGDSEKDLVFGSGEEADMKTLNMGANFIAGYCFSNGMFFSANYNIGLSNLGPGSSDDGSSLKSHYFGIKIGYFFK